MDRVIFMDMPCRIRAFTCEDADGFQTTIINSRLSFEQNKKSAEHETKHAADFLNKVDVNKLESIRHEKE